MKTKTSRPFLIAILICFNGGYEAYATGLSSTSINLSAPTVLASAADGTARAALALASADFDEDGVPDLVASYAGAQGSHVSVRRGNVDAIYPNSSEAKARKNQGQFTEAAFLAKVRNFALPEAADLIGAGDFDADGHWDIVAARRGGSKLYWLRGDDRGGFAPAESIELHGAVTALVTGEMNRADGLTDIAVGIVTQDGARVLVFESPEGALGGAPESFPLPAAANALAFGQLDDDRRSDFAIASGNEVIIIHGRDRKLSLGVEQRADVKPAEVSRTVLDSAVLSVVVGDFAGDSGLELAVLTADGRARVLERGSQKATEFQSSEAMTLNVATGSTLPMRLLAAKVSSLPKDDLLVFGGTNAVQVLTTSTAKIPSSAAKNLTSPGTTQLSVTASVTADSEVISVLPMRLNADALQGMVMLTKNDTTPSVVIHQTAATFVVNIEGNTNDMNPGDGVCSDTDGNCSFNAALQEANAHPGADTINFNIPGGGVHTLSHGFGQYFNEAVTIDGTTQPDGRIEIVANGDYPVVFFGGNSVLRGVATYGSNVAIILASNNNIVEGNYVGFRADGTVPIGFGTSGSGITFRGGINGSLRGDNNLIGGTTAQARNVISNCVLALQLADSVGNVFRGNYIGTNVAGTAAFSNATPFTSFGGEVTIGGTTAGAGNLISGNGSTAALLIQNSAAIIQGNLIGTTADGSQPIANSGIGINVSTDEVVTIGGTTPAARNVIAANSIGIVIVQDQAGSKLVQGNFIGTNATGTGALPNLSHGIQTRGSLSALSVTIGGVVAGAGNLISGNGGDGISVAGGINGIPSRAVIQGNLIGTDVNGVVAIPNTGNGIQLPSSTGTLIGGTSVQARNIISGNSTSGIRLTAGANSGRIEGNYIGLNRFGTGALGNNGDGVFFTYGFTLGITVGGTASGASNTIAFNGGAGVASANGYLLIAAVRANSIHDNGGLGIDIGDDGVTKNTPGSNSNFPVITSAQTTDTGTTIQGTLQNGNYTAGITYTLQFFSNTKLDPSGYGEGQTYIGQTTITTDGTTSPHPFSLTVTPAVPPGRFITAVAFGKDQFNQDGFEYLSEFSFAARVTGQTTPENTPLRLELITPMLGGDNGIATVTITGEGIIDGVTVVLRRVGQPDIIGAISSTDGYSLTARFNLTGQTLGDWDVVVMRLDGTSATLPGAFTIEATRPARGFVEILGRNRIGPHRSSTFYVSYGNAGNVDVYDVVLLLHLPKGAAVSVLNGLTLPPGFEPAPGFEGVSIETETETLVPVWFYVLPASETRGMTFTINLRDIYPAPAALELKAELLMPPASESEFSRTGDYATLPAWFGPNHRKNPFFLALLSLDLAKATTQQQQPSHLANYAAQARGAEAPLEAGFDPFDPDFNSGAKMNDAVNNGTFQGALDQGPIPGPYAYAGGIALTIIASGVALGAGVPVGTVALVVSGLFTIWGIISTGESAQAAVAKYVIQVGNSGDPNEMVGPAGAGSQRYITSDGQFGYSVFFENTPNATAPAQNVVVTDRLDTSKFDLSTFSFGTIRFGDSTFVSVPLGQKSLAVDVDLRPSKNLIVRVIGGLDASTGMVTWNFQAIDPATGQPPDDITVGFLPPNVNGTEGEGSVLFTVAPKPGFADGTQLLNKATIVFDGNAPLDTNEWLNTIDNSLPSSNVSPLAASQNSRFFQVNWSGTDTGAGIAAYTIYVSENGGPYTIWLANTPDTTAIYDGKPNSGYAFYSIAQDGAGNNEDLPATADASTTTPSSAPVQLVSVVSTKHHGAVGWFDVDLPLSGDPGIECRSGGANGDYTLFFTFANALTRVDGVSISTGSDTLNGGAIAADAHQYFLHLTGISSGQYVEVTLQGAGDEAGNYSDVVQTVMGVLVGDTTGDGHVNSSDISQTKAECGHAVTSANFRNDVTANGAINGSDISLVKSKSGTGLPTQPAPNPERPAANKYQAPTHAPVAAR